MNIKKMDDDNTYLIGYDEGITNAQVAEALRCNYGIDESDYVSFSREDAEPSHTNNDDDLGIYVEMRHDYENVEILRVRY